MNEKYSFGIDFENIVYCSDSGSFIYYFVYRIASEYSHVVSYTTFWSSGPDRSYRCNVTYVI